MRARKDLSLSANATYHRCPHYLGRRRCLICLKQIAACNELTRKRKPRSTHSTSLNIAMLHVSYPSVLQSDFSQRYKNHSPHPCDATPDSTCYNSSTTSASTASFKSNVTHFPYIFSSSKPTQSSASVVRGDCRLFYNTLQLLCPSTCIVYHAQPQTSLFILSDTTLAHSNLG